MRVIIMKRDVNSRPLYFSKNNLEPIDNIMNATKFRGEEVASYYLKKIHNKCQEYKSWIVEVPDVLFYNDENIIDKLTETEYSEYIFQFAS